MNEQESYKLIVKAITSETLVEGEFFDITYEFINISGIVYPGGKLRVYMSWPNIASDYYVYHDLTIKQLEFDEAQKIAVRDKASSSGMTTFITATPSFNAIDKKLTHLYLEDGRKLDPMQVFGASRAKSREEVIQEELIRVSKESIKSQNFLARVQIVLAIIGVVIAFLQALMIINPLFS